MKITVVLSLLCVAALSACTSIGQIVPDKISTTPSAGSLPIPITSPKIVTDLEDAAKNLDQALAIGALAKDDPAPGCLHDVLQKAGIELPPGAVAPQSFSPVNSGVISLGTILYIQARQLQAARGNGVSIGTPCLAVVGQIHLDALMATAKVGSAALGVSGGGLFNLTGGILVPGAGLVKP